MVIQVLDGALASHNSLQVQERNRSTTCSPVRTTDNRQESREVRFRGLASEGELERPSFIQHLHEEAQHGEHSQPAVLDPAHRGSRH